MHIILGADYMIKHCPVNHAGLFTKTNYGLVLQKNFISLERDELFKWKQPATKGSFTNNLTISAFK